MWEFQIKFYLNIYLKNEYSGLGDNTSDSSDRLLQRGCGEMSIYKILVKGS